MASNIQKILKIAANNSFNNDTVNTLITQVNDVSNNLSDLCGNFISPNKLVLHDLSTNDISCVSLTVNGIPITMNGGGGSNITSINELTDVSVNNINNGQTISWNASEGYFEASTIADNITSINALNDISINNIVDGQVMAWNASGGYFEAVNQGGATINTINDISDISLNNIQNGQTLAWNATKGYFEAASSIQGPSGEQGLQGVKGDTGAAGLQGVKGDTGAAGLQGIQGDTGTAGLQGIQGIQGDTGAAGLQGPS